MRIARITTNKLFRTSKVIRINVNGDYYDSIMIYTGMPISNCDEFPIYRDKMTIHVGKMLIEFDPTSNIVDVDDILYYIVKTISGVDDDNR